MKKNLILASLLILGFVSCRKSIDEVNNGNPNQFSKSEPKFMITGAQLANVMLNEGPPARLAGIFAGHFTGYDRQYIAYGNYNMTAGDFNDDWGNMYSEGLAQARLTYAAAAEKKDSVLMGVAMITEANILLSASSLWGDIPNTQACDVNAFPNPKYDKMSDVHDYCISQLTKAAALVKSADNSTYAAAYTGTFTWAEVANTLMARAYLHKKDYANALAAANNGLAAGHDFLANHSTASAGARNLYDDFLDWNRSGYMSCDGSFISVLLDSGNTKYKGNAKTDERDRYAYYFVADNYTPLDPNMNDGIFTETSSFPIASNVENELIQAECYSKTNDDTKALDHLNNVRAILNTQFAGSYSAYVAGDFGTGKMVDGNSASDALYKEILREKYCSLFGQIEPFCDVRRTGNVLNVPPKVGAKLPGRFLIPQVEINTNSNCPKNPDIFTALDLWK